MLLPVLLLLLSVLLLLFVVLLLILSVVLFVLLPSDLPLFALLYLLSLSLAVLFVYVVTV